MLNFISFGSGSSGNCYYLGTESDGLLIDAGLGIRLLKKYIKDFGLMLPVFRNILITHDHADHIKSAGIISYELNVPVYATDKVHHGIDGNYQVRRKIDGALRRKVVKNEEFTAGEFTVTAYDVPHDSSDNVAYEIRVQGVTVSIITDAGSLTEELCGVISRADYLIIEANHDEEMLTQGSYPPYLKTRILGPQGHLSNRTCAEALADNMSDKLKHIWLCHLSEENNHPELARKTVETILADRGKLSPQLTIEVLKRRKPQLTQLIP